MIDDARVANVRYSIRWSWLTASILTGALLLAAFILLVDADMARMRAVGAVFAATLLLMGILIGYRSTGTTTWEPALAGFVLVVLAGIALAFSSRAMPAPSVIATAVVGGPLLGYAGGWVGEMLQGTLQDDSEGVQWLWVGVAIVFGFMAGIYALFVAEALVGLNYLVLLGTFGSSFMLTGFTVGYFSPGRTVLEPAIAIGGIVVLDLAFSLVQFHAIFPLAAVLLVILAGVVLAVTGAWLGEAAQDIRDARRGPAARPGPADAPG